MSSSVSELSINNKAVGGNNNYPLLKDAERTKAISKNVTYKVKHKTPLIPAEKAMLGCPERKNKMRRDVATKENSGAALTVVQRNKQYWTVMNVPTNEYK